MSSHYYNLKYLTKPCILVLVQGKLKGSKQLMYHFPTDKIFQKLHTPVSLQASDTKTYKKILAWIVTIKCFIFTLISNHLFAVNLPCTVCQFYLKQTGSEHSVEGD